ncbi:DUF2721 domain-containing protein [[Eubacterium] cellulosolvens]
MSSIEIPDLLAYIQQILTPIAMISGVGIMTLFTQTRYGRIVDATRRLTHDKINLIRSKVSKNLTEQETSMNEKIIDHIDIQLDILIRRGAYLKRALILLLTGIFLFIFTSLSILLQEIVPSIFIVPLTITTFIAGLVSLIYGGVFILIDLTLSHKAALIAVESAAEIYKTFE